LNFNNIAIIPARGVSKRIPKKNIKDFLGKPIIAYSIEIAISCKLFNKVIVSTDDQQIKKVDFVCCIYPTAPLIQKNDILKGYELIKNEKWNTVIAATHYTYPVHRSFIKFPDGGLKMLFPEHFNSRSQDLPKVYHDAGQFFWAKPKKWQNPTKGFDQYNTIVEIPANRVQDIDTYEDWKKAELIYKTIYDNEH